jgi:hypothetical protein
VAINTHLWISWTQLPKPGREKREARDAKKNSG